METYHKIQTLFKRHTEGENKGKMIRGEWTTPELEYLAGNEWEFTEKVDGTNIRIGWDARTGTVDFAGRTDKAVIPEKLLEVLYRVFTPERFLSAGLAGTYTLYGEGYGPKIQNGGNYSDIQNFVLFDVTCDNINLCYEHEELLNVIQNESTSLRDSVAKRVTSASTRQNSRLTGSTGPNCTCHKIGDWWLSRKDVDDVAAKLGIDSVPTIGTGTLHDAIDIVASGITFEKSGAVKRWGSGTLQSQWGNFAAEGIVARPVVPMFDRKGQRIITKIKAVDFK